MTDGPVETFLAELGRHLGRDERRASASSAEVGDHLRDLAAEAAPAGSTTSPRKSRRSSGSARPASSRGDSGRPAGASRRARVRSSSLLRRRRVRCAGVRPAALGPRPSSARTADVRSRASAAAADSTTARPPGDQMPRRDAGRRSLRVRARSSAAIALGPGARAGSPRRRFQPTHREPRCSPRRTDRRRLLRASTARYLRARRRARARARRATRASRASPRAGRLPPLASSVFWVTAIMRAPGASSTT